MDDEQLRAGPVYRNLDYRWQKFGIGLDDVPFLAAPAVVGLFLVAIVEISVAWLLLIELCAVLFLMLVKWRQPQDYLPNLLILAFAPRRLAHKDRDPECHQLPALAPRGGSHG